MRHVRSSTKAFRPGGSPARVLWSCVLLAGLLLSTALGAATEAADPWESLRQQYFGDRPIVAGARSVIELEAPARAEDAAVVPLTIKDKLPSDGARRIRTIYLFIDKNPGPVAAIFRFAPDSARADIATRVRINEYTNVRAVAETDDGQLFMDTRFVKASGGCSAPAAKDAEAALARLGKMKVRLQETAAPGTPQLAQLMISHPNNSGLQKDQLTGLHIPAHFVREIAVSYAGKPLLTAETTFSLSENPSLRFYFLPREKGELKVEAVDTKDQRFSTALEVAPHQASAQRTQ